MDDLSAGILVIDFGSQTTLLIARRVRELGVYSEVWPCNDKRLEAALPACLGVVLSGGPASVGDAAAPRLASSVLGSGLPVLGICYGMQLVVEHFGGKVAPGPSREFGRTTVSQQPDVTSRLLEGVELDGSQVWMSHNDVASELPLLVIAELVGCPVEDRSKLFNWSNQMIGFEDPDFANEVGAADAMAEMFEYAGHLAQLRRNDPREDLTSVLLSAEVDGERLDELAFNMFFMLLILAGNETTRNAISGGMLALSEHPDQRSKLAQDLSLLPRATEEILRYVSPVISMRRTATRDVELGGQKIAENEKVVMFYPSANRDPEVFDRPDRFDINRDPNVHLAFGWGPHFCLGANLARAEIRIVFSELLTRLPDIEVCGPVRRLRSSTVNSIKSMPVRFTPES